MVLADLRALDHSLASTRPGSCRALRETRLTVLRLARKKPWAIDVAYFTPAELPIYLTDIAVSVAHQGQGLGRQALTDAVAATRELGADAIRLHAYDGDVGTGAFYAAFGYQERSRVLYKGNPLVYYELLLD